MCAWRVLAMLRRVACVGACHNLSPHHAARFCCAAALGARVHRCGKIGTFVIVKNYIPTHPYTFTSTEAVLQRVFFLFFLRRSQMADSRQRAESKTLQVGTCACACISSLYGGELLFFVMAYVTCYCPLSPSFLIRDRQEARRGTCGVRCGTY